MDLQTFMHTYYRPLHGPLVLSICVFGILTQSLNIAVLTRRPMRTMPSNILLAGLSVAQLILLTNFIIGTSYSLRDSPCNPGTKSYAWLAYLLFNVNVNLVFHTIALVHTTLLAVFRYAAVRFPIQSRRLVSVRGARTAVISAFCVVPLACSSFYANSTIVERTNRTSILSCLWEYKEVYILKYTENRALRDYNFVFFGTVCKLLPCAGMIVLSALLLMELKKVEHKRRGMTIQRSADSLATPGSRENSKHFLPGSSRQTSRNFIFAPIRTNSNMSFANNNLIAAAGNSTESSPSSNQSRYHRQTTIMLVSVVLLLVFVELPQGVLNLLSVIMDGYEFGEKFYAPLGDLFEMLTVLYSSVNFIIYCLMSSQFRKMFKELFHFDRSGGGTPSRNNLIPPNPDPRSSTTVIGGGGNRKMFMIGGQDLRQSSKERIALMMSSPERKKKDIVLVCKSENGSMSSIKSNLVVEGRHDSNLR